MIRARGCAGDNEIFREFFAAVEDLVFSMNETVETALANVRRSKEQIDLENINRRGYDVKLGRGGIREIEFIAQALQLAHGGLDRWLRSPHTLISLSRLADRDHLSRRELSQLSAAYTFLRRTEHALQMENGNQTHTVPDEPEKRALLARRMTFAAGGDFESDLKTHTENVSRVYSRIFGPTPEPPVEMRGTERVTFGTYDPSGKAGGFDLIASVSPHFAAMLDVNPDIAAALPERNAVFIEPDYKVEMMSAVHAGTGSGSDWVFRDRLAALRRTWQGLLLPIAIADIFEQITIREAKRLQTMLAEASIAAALEIVKHELAKRFSTTVDELPLAVLALGKLGGRGLDYNSDLDLIVVYDDTRTVPDSVGHAEYYGRAVELFVTVLSSITRDGNIYRVDLRLRPFGSKGMSAIAATAFLEYIRDTAAIWEMLAFVKLRAAGGDMELASSVEVNTRSIIHERAAAVDVEELREETRRVRLALEKKHSRARRGKEFDIKYGSGGMLDVYFAMRFLQLRSNVPDDDENRSTPFMLERLANQPSLVTCHSSLAALRLGYEFLSALDHNLRLTVGRTTRVPLANHAALETIARRMNLASAAELLEHLTLHRLALRSAFEQVLD
jgi:glutamate-ammonia-ligase adenylyltransferase